MILPAAPWMDPARPVAAALEDAGHCALLVGGCVRNALMGRAVTDLDLATDAHPGTVIARAEVAGLKVVPTGLAHGTVTVITGGTPVEVTTFRRDVATDGRHATVAFAQDVAEDAARRDFTMNALYADLRGRVIDPLGGMDDLRARHVRFVGDPDRRIAEDYLRILRFFRFHAIYGDADAGLDAEGLAACASGAEGLARLSRERVGAEMGKLLSAADPAPAVAAMAQAGVLARVLPGADATALPVLVHLEGDLPPDPIRRLALLGGEADLRLSKADATRLTRIAAAARDGTAPPELAYRHGAALARDAALVRAALIGTPPALDGLAEAAAARFPVTAADLMPALKGPALGHRLRELEARWIASGFRLTKDQLLG
ncbi:CCA tRNA nucleotidyltransferase [Falsirhodobacter halotolerans]|uniref:CCA tRNA nucleotidyltransferase n=1 Tax=Falsirhodobacter halotolerans TaxID=1146892 RepID=UPI001FD49BA8|nr:CCA tRNA nucleotidyltransferase [Falsirhodobacter halotolerans]MCJ8138321.1 CCA tRNA nucleotidyltransferase [Falsirhodobacter halotolerans]